ATTGVQDELLKLLEDGDYEVNISDNQFAPKYVTFNTENVTFICSGAFSQLKAKKQAKLGKPISGFGQSSSSSKPNNENTTKITTEDLVTYGLKEELVGRLPNIIELNNLSKDNLITIMKNPNNSVLNENIKIFEELGVSVNVEEEIYNLVAERALKKNTGARGLTSVIDNLFIKAMNDISQNPDSYSELIITKETLDNPKKYTLVRKKDN
ncbi:MAG: AAA family ATPase, partial [Bacilli bacterium]|nr:AAA family ATPase [Bacilli bacterium]